MKFCLFVTLIDKPLCFPMNKKDIFPAYIKALSNYSFLRKGNRFKSLIFLKYIKYVVCHLSKTFWYKTKLISVHVKGMVLTSLCIVDPYSRVFRGVLSIIKHQHGNSTRESKGHVPPFSGARPRVRIKYSWITGKHTLILARSIEMQVN